MPPVYRHGAEEDFAPVRRLQAGHAFEEGRLAGPVRSDQAENLARPDREADAVKSLKPSIGLAEPIDPNDSLSMVVGVHPLLQPIQRRGVDIVATVSDHCQPKRRASPHQAEAATLTGRVNSLEPRPRFSMWRRREMWPRFGVARSVAIRSELMLSAAKRKLLVAITKFT